MFSPANTSKQLSDYPDKGLYFRLGPSDILQGQVLAEVIAEDGNASLVIMNFDDDYGNGLAEDLEGLVRGRRWRGDRHDHLRPAGADVRRRGAARPRRPTPDAIALIGFDETSRLLVDRSWSRASARKTSRPTGRRQHRQPLGERFDAGK